MRKSSRISGFYKLSIEERIKKLSEYFDLHKQEVQALSSQGSLTLDQADKMIENVVGIFSLPIGLGLNFLINDSNYMVPMAVEEPSIIAAASNGAKIIRNSGGFTASSDPSIMIGQIQILECKNFEKTKEDILSRKTEIIKLANKIEPNMKERGGGAKDLEIRILGNEKEFPFKKMLIVHLIIDTCDAMGANVINSMVEGVTPLINEIIDGRVCLRILSNFADRRLVRAKAKISTKDLETKNISGEKVRDGIIDAYHFAYLDPYRATTHNKGIMNGIDPVIIATGNDWRSIEAAAHTYAAKSGKYLPLAHWSKDENGYLIGEIELPMAVGIVGGAINIHPMTKIALKFLGVKSAGELGEVIASVGLAQNLTALKALATEGIQRGHMSLHARSVAVTAGASGKMVEEITKQMIAENNIKVDRAAELLEAMKLNS